MNRDELRRLAIRLAKHLRYHQSSPEEDYCMECEMINRRGQSRHGADCPIAELEAEEAASKAKSEWDRLQHPGEWRGPLEGEAEDRNPKSSRPYNPEESS